MKKYIDNAKRFLDRWIPMRSDRIAMLEETVRTQDCTIERILKDMQVKIRLIETLEAELQSKESELRRKERDCADFIESTQFSLKALSLMRTEIHAAIELLQGVAKED